MIVFSYYTDGVLCSIFLACFCLKICFKRFLPYVILSWIEIGFSTSDFKLDQQCVYFLQKSLAHLVACTGDLCNLITL